MTEMRAVQNDGHWGPIIKWLDECAGGSFRIPVFHRPPITRNHDGSLNVENKTARYRAEIGDWVALDDNGEFHVIKKATYDSVRGQV